MAVVGKNYQDVFKSLLAKNTFLRYVPLHTILSQTTVSGSAVSDTEVEYFLFSKIFSSDKFKLTYIQLCFRVPAASKLQLLEGKVEKLQLLQPTRFQRRR